MLSGRFVLLGPCGSGKLPLGAVDDLRARLVATVGAVEPLLDRRPVCGFLPDNDSVVGIFGTGEFGCRPLSKRVAEPLGVFRLKATRPDGIAVDEDRRSPRMDVRIGRSM